MRKEGRNKRKGKGEKEGKGREGEKKERKGNYTKVNKTVHEFKLFSK